MPAANHHLFGNRRTFLKSTLAGAAAGAFAPQSALVFADRVQLLSDEERRRLLELANFGRKEPDSGKQGLVICSHPLATRAGVDVLKAGGNAADAALATSVCQTVVEPHMTGITGVLSMLYFDAATGETTYVNGSAARPAAPLDGFSPADLATGRGVAVPRFLGRFRSGPCPPRPGLSRKPSWKRRSAMPGTGSKFIRSSGARFSPSIRTSAAPAQGREIFSRKQHPARPGDLLVQKRAADTLTALLEDGNDYFYRGAFAKELVDVVQAAGGVLTLEDMEQYEARWQPPAQAAIAATRCLARRRRTTAVRT